MKQKIYRKYLEIKSLKDFNEVKKPNENYSITLVDPKDFQLNKFFYKEVGKNCKWVDRLSWDNSKWSKYISNPKIFTYMLKDGDQIAGYFELIYETNINEAEIAYFGILEEYFGNKLGGYLLSEAIRYAFSKGAKRLWVHTCSNDHANALKNYLSRGMKIFKSETLIV